MEQLYELLNTSRQWYHQKLNRLDRTKVRELPIVELIKNWRKRHPQMSSRIMFYSLKCQGHDLSIGVNKFEKIVIKYGLGCGRIYSRKPKTSDGLGREHYPNLTNGLIINDICKLMVGDITYFDINGKWHYIFTIKDVYSQLILSLVASRTLESKYVLMNIKDCIKQRGIALLIACILHSDNGSQYNSKLVKSKLGQLKIQISRAKNCHENGSAEQLNHIIKNMYLEHWSITTFEELKQACTELKYINNHERAIKQLGNLTPVAFEKYLKTIEPNQRPKKQMHDFDK